MPAMTAVPAHADAHARLPVRHVRADGIDDARPLRGPARADIGCRGLRPLTVNMSLWQTPQACTLMRTWPRLGLGNVALDDFESALGLGICTAFIAAWELQVTGPECQ